MTPQEAKRAYEREWRRKNPDKTKAIKERYWAKKAAMLTAESKSNQSEQTDSQNGKSDSD